MADGPRRRKRKRKPAPGADGFPSPFGTYLLLEAFARGGMGEVYLAKSGQIEGFERYCVLKKLRPDLLRDGEYVRRFLDEARVVVQLGHANIAHVFDVGRVEDEFYLAMEYVAGQDLRTLHERAIAGGAPLSPPVALHVIGEVLEGLDYAHRRKHPGTGQSLNLVHRDVSPQNVMVSYEGEVKLIDFGLAASRLKVERTEPHVVMGKMAYMAPEQARGDMIDATADQFAVAVMLYELTVGERFYEGMTAQQIWQVVGRGGFVPRAWNTVEPDLGRILSKALHPVAAERFETCGDFRAALMGHLHSRYPGTGGREVRQVLGTLFGEEIEREAGYLAQFADVNFAQFKAQIEVTRAVTVSIADDPTLGHQDAIDEAFEEAQKVVRGQARDVPRLERSDPELPEQVEGEAWLKDLPTQVDGAPVESRPPRLERPRAQVRVPSAEDEPLTASGQDPRLPFQPDAGQTPAAASEASAAMPRTRPVLPDVSELPTKQTPSAEMVPERTQAVSRAPAAASLPVMAGAAVLGVLVVLGAWWAMQRGEGTAGVDAGAPDAQVQVDAGATVRPEDVPVGTDTEPAPDGGTAPASPRTQVKPRAKPRPRQPRAMAAGVSKRAAAQVAAARSVMVDKGYARAASSWPRAQRDAYDAVERAETGTQRLVAALALRQSVDGAPQKTGARDRTPKTPAVPTKADVAGKMERIRACQSPCRKSVLVKYIQWQQGGERNTKSFMRHVDRCLRQCR